MTKIISYEYCALVIEVLMLVSVYIRNMTRGRVNRWFVAIVSALILATTTDIASMILERRGSEAILGTYIANAVCLWATSSSSALLAGYLFSQAGIFNQIRNNKTMKAVFYLPSIVNTIFIFLVNPFNKIIFYIDDSGVYHRGEGVLIMYALSLVYVYIGVSVVVRYRNIFTLRKSLSVFLLLSSSLIAMLIQMVFPNMIVQMFCTAVAALILFLEVHAPEEKMHAGTGLFNLHAYVQDVKNLFSIDVKFDVILVSITNYKALVEMFGYFETLSIVQILSKKLLEYIRNEKLDIDIYYLENGSFAIISDEKYAERAYEIGQSINGIMAADYMVNSVKISIMANVCVINCPQDIQEPEFLISFDGQLRSEVYSGELRYAEKLFDKELALKKRDFEKILDRAFTNNSLEIHYQPIYTINELKCFAVEGFIRLNDPVYGNISPEFIITEAEKTGAIHAITTYVLEEACKFISKPEFLLLGLEYVEINLSPIQCMWSDLLSVVLSTIRNYNVQAKYIVFNITDIDNYDLYSRMKDNLLALSQVGFRLIMDDFGSGIFEIERISELPLTAIKLDKTFVQNGVLEENRKILKGTIRLINDTDRRSAAIGVEDEETLNVLREFGCESVQGYYFCKPIPEKELIKFLLLER